MRLKLRMEKEAGGKQSAPFYFDANDKKIKKIRPGDEDQFNNETHVVEITSKKEVYMLDGSKKFIPGTLTYWRKLSQKEMEDAAIDNMYRGFMHDDGTVKVLTKPRLRNFPVDYYERGEVQTPKRRKPKEIYKRVEEKSAVEKQRETFEYVKTLSRSSISFDINYHTIKRYRERFLKSDSNKYSDDDVRRIIENEILSGEHIPTNPKNNTGGKDGVKSYCVKGPSGETIYTFMLDMQYAIKLKYRNWAKITLKTFMSNKNVGGYVYRDGAGEENEESRKQRHYDALESELILELHDLHDQGQLNNINDIKDPDDREELKSMLAEIYNRAIYIQRDSIEAKGSIPDDDEKKGSWERYEYLAKRFPFQLEDMHHILTHRFHEYNGEIEHICEKIIGEEWEKLKEIGKQINGAIKKIGTDFRHDLWHLSNSDLEGDNPVIRTEDQNELINDINVLISLLESMYNQTEMVKRRIYTFHPDIYSDLKRLEPGTFNNRQKNQLKRKQPISQQEFHQDMNSPNPITYQDRNGKEITRMQRKLKNAIKRLAQRMLRL